MIEFFIERSSRFGFLPEISSVEIVSRCCDAAFGALPVLWRSDGDRVKFLARPKIEPCELINVAKAVRVDADIVNGLDVHFTGRILVVNWEGWKFSYQEEPQTRSLREAARVTRLDNHVTGRLSLERVDGAEFGSGEAWGNLFEFTRFLTFARGSGVGVGNVVGRCASGEVVFSLFGFSRRDPFIGQNGWYDLTSVKELPEAAAKYMTAAASDVDGLAVKRATDFYRAANAIRPTSLEVSLVSAFSGVEGNRPA